MSKYSLVGIDGNAYSIMGYVSNALKREGLRELIDEYREKAMSLDYAYLLVVSMNYLDKANEKAGDDECENNNTFPEHCKLPEVPD